MSNAESDYSKLRLNVKPLNNLPLPCYNYYHWQGKKRVFALLKKYFAKTM